MAQNPAEPSSRTSYLFLFLCGVCMGAADLIPGISGGTIAFIMGFYDRLLESLKTLNGSSFKLLFLGRFKEFFKAVAWRFLSTLLMGVLFAFIVLANAFHFILEHESYRVYLYSGFLGLIAASFTFCLRQVKSWKATRSLGLFVGIAAAYFLTGATTGQALKGSYAVEIKIERQTPERRVNNYDQERRLLTGLTPAALGALVAKKAIESSAPVYNGQGVLLGPATDFIQAYQPRRFDYWLTFCGAIAVCALLLPGISGSYLLALLGVYPLVIAALSDWVMAIKRFSFDDEAFYTLLSLGVGIAGGLVLFARFVSWLLKTFPDMTVVVLSGFMIGAMRSIWPFWSYEYALNPLKLSQGPQLVLMDPLWPSFISPAFLYSCLCAIFGFCLVWIIEYAARVNFSSDFEPTVAE